MISLALWCTVVLSALTMGVSVWASRRDVRRLNESERQVRERLSQQRLSAVLRRNGRLFL